MWLRHGNSLESLCNNGLSLSVSDSELALIWFSCRLLNNAGSFVHAPQDTSLGRDEESGLWLVEIATLLFQVRMVNACVYYPSPKLPSTTKGVFPHGEAGLEPSRLDMVMVEPWLASE